MRAGKKAWNSCKDAYNSYILLCNGCNFGDGSIFIVVCLQRIKNETKNFLWT
jgi:hypothetical protein